MKLNYEEYKDLIGETVLVMTDTIERKFYPAKLGYNEMYECFITTDGWVVVEIQDVRF